MRRRRSLSLERWPLARKASVLAQEIVLLHDQRLLAERLVKTRVTGDTRRPDEAVPASDPGQVGETLQNASPGDDRATAAKRGRFPALAKRERRGGRRQLPDKPIRRRSDRRGDPGRQRHFGHALDRTLKRPRTRPARLLDSEQEARQTKENIWRRGTDVRSVRPVLECGRGCGSLLRMQDDLDRPILLLLEDLIGVRRLRQRKMVGRECVHA